MGIGWACMIGKFVMDTGLELEVKQYKGINYVWPSASVVE